MTPEQVTLVQASFAKIRLSSDQVAAIFYGRLFEIAPELKKLFPADMTSQRRKLMSALTLVVNILPDMESLLPAACCLRQAHSPSATSNMELKLKIICLSAQPCCGPLKEDLTMTGRRTSRRLGPSLTERCRTS
jgi:Globin